MRSVSACAGYGPCGQFCTNSMPSKPAFALKSSTSQIGNCLPHFAAEEANPFRPIAVFHGRLAKAPSRRPAARLAG